MDRYELIGKLKAQAFLEDFKARVKLEQVVAAATPQPSGADEAADRIRRNYDEAWSVPLAAMLEWIFDEAVLPVLEISRPSSSLTAAGEFSGDVDPEFAKILKSFGITPDEFKRAMKIQNKERLLPTRVPLKPAEVRKLKGIGESNLRAPFCLQPDEKQIIKDRLAELMSNIDYDSETVALDTIGTSLRGAGLHGESEFSSFILKAPERIFVPEPQRIEHQDVTEEIQKKRDALSEKDRELARRAAEREEEEWRKRLKEIDERLDQDNYFSPQAKKADQNAKVRALRQLGVPSESERLKFEREMEKWRDREALGKSPNPLPLDPTITFQDRYEEYLDEVANSSYKDVAKKLTAKQKALDNLDAKRQNSWRQMYKVFTYNEDGDLEFYTSNRKYRYLTQNIPGNDWYSSFVRDYSFHAFPPIGTYTEPIEEIVGRYLNPKVGKGEPFLNPSTSPRALQEAKTSIRNFLFENARDIEEDNLEKLMNNRSFLQNLRNPVEVKRSKPLGDVDPCLILEDTLSAKDLENVRRVTRERAEKILQGHLDDLEKRFCLFEGNPRELVENLNRGKFRAFASDVSATASNEALHLFAANQGPNTRKRWEATFHNTRPAHVAAHGQTIGSGKEERFLVGGEWMRHPHDPSASPKNVFNCLCSMAILLEDNCGGTHTASLSDRFRRTPKR